MSNLPFKKLLVFGDSWPYGCELENYRPAFPELMEQILQLPVENHSLFSTSIDHMVHKLLSMIEKNEVTDCGILFCLTGTTRSMIFDKTKLKEIHPNNTDVESKMYYSYIFSWELAEFNFLRNCLLIQSICKLKNIPLYFVANWYSIPNNELLDKTIFYNKSLIEILGHPPMEVKNGYLWDTVAQSEYFYPNNYHPNAKGHKLIAEELSKWISFQ